MPRQLGREDGVEALTNFELLERYTKVQRSQYLIQADPRIFGQSYVADCSSVDGQAIFLREANDHRHIEFFQGLKKFREPGLPYEFRVALEEDLDADPGPDRTLTSWTRTGRGYFLVIFWFPLLARLPADNQGRPGDALA